MPIAKSLHLIFKSYKARGFDNGLGSGGPPNEIVLRIDLKKGVEVKYSVQFTGAWFSESRGTGGTSKRASYVIEDANIQQGIREVIKTGDVTGLIILIDRIKEVAEGAFLASVDQWWRYAAAKNASALLDEERRDRAFANKKYSIGDVVGKSYSYNELYTITSEHFDYRPYLGGGWRYSFPGYSGEAQHFWTPTEEQKATLPIVKFDATNRRIN